MLFNRTKNLNNPINYIWENWAGNIQCRPAFFFEPETENEIISIVKKVIGSGKRIKIVGSGHSTSKIIESDDLALVSLDRYKKVISIDKETNKVIVQAGIRIFGLNDILSNSGLALPNLGAIDEQSISGAISTGTHGTGLKYGSIASFVTEITFINGLGEIVTVSKHKDPSIFEAIKISFGSMGIISTLTLQCIPTFNMEFSEHTEKLQETLSKINEYLEKERFGIWWFPHIDKTRVMIMENTTKKAKNINGLKRTLSNWKVVLINNLFHELLLWVASFKPLLIPLVNRFIQNLLYKKPSKKTVTSRSGFKNIILVKQVVMEYSLPINNLKEALYQLKNLISEKKYFVHSPIDIRFSKGDDEWLSPSYGRESCYIGIIMYRPFCKSIPYTDYFKQAEDIFVNLGGRPHWGKINYRTSEDFTSMYPKWRDFINIRNSMDPNGIFLNEYLQSIMKVGIETDEI